MYRWHYNRAGACSCSLGGDRNVVDGNYIATRPVEAPSEGGAHGHGANPVFPCDTTMLNQRSLKLARQL